MASAAGPGVDEAVEGAVPLPPAVRYPYPCDSATALAMRRFERVLLGCAREPAAAVDGICQPAAAPAARPPAAAVRLVAAAAAGLGEACACSWCRRCLWASGARAASHTKRARCP